MLVTVSPLQLAVRLAACGWYILPLSPTSKRPLANCERCQTTGAAHPIQTCPCLSEGAWCHGVRAATTDPDRLAEWWSRQPDAVPGLAAGPSGLVLIDLDAHSEPLADNPAEVLPGIDLDATDLTSADLHTGMDTLRLLAAVRGGSCPWSGDLAYRPLVVVNPSGGRPGYRPVGYRSGYQRHKNAPREDLPGGVSTGSGDRI